MALSAGDPVHVPGIGTGVIREVRRGGRYVVLVKNTTIVVAEAQIVPADPPSRRRRPARAAAPEPTGAESSRPHTPASIDLHGLTVPEAEAALDSCLNDALLAGVREVRVIHGRSGGRLRAAVHGRLRRLAVVRAFRVDPLNPGMTIVEL